MNKVFVDTVALIAIGDADDSLHEKAMQMRQLLIHQQYHFVTTEAVLLELCNAFSSPYKNLRQTAIDTIQDIRKSSRWTVIHVDRTLWNQGFDRFKSREDKTWSLIDCIGMIVAEKHNITEIFTHDDDFQQAGFTILI